MNTRLLAELDRRARHVEHVASGSEQDDPEILFQELLAHAAAVAGTDSPEYALAVRLHASHCRNAGELDRAVGEYTRAIGLLERAGDEARVPLVLSLTAVSALHARLGQPAHARETAERAMDLIVEYAGDPDRYAPPAEGEPDTTSPAGVIAVLANGVAEARAAERTDEGLRACDALARRLGARPDHQLAVLLSRAALEEARGQAPPRETFARSWAVAASSASSESGAPTPAQWVQLGRLALRCAERERGLEAARMLRRLAAAPGAPPPALELDALALEAAAALAGGDAGTAELALGEGLRLCRASFGKDDPRSADAELALGRHLVDHGRAGEAVEMLRHAVAVHGANASPAGVELAESSFTLAVALDRSGSDTEAIDLYRLAYGEYARAAGPTHPGALQSAINLAETARVARDWETAEHWFRVAIGAASAAGARGAPNAGHALNNLAETLLAAGRLDEAAPLAEEALALRGERPGRGSDAYARTLSVVATLAAKRGDRARLQEAMDELRAASGSGPLQLPVDLVLAWLELDGEYERAAGICEQVLGTLEDPPRPADPSRLPGQGITLRFALGALLARLGRWREARRRLAEAFEMETRFLGDQAGQRSQRQMQLLLTESRGRIALLLDLLLHAPEPATEDARHAYDVVQQRKGLETRLLAIQKPSFVTDRTLTSAPPERVRAVGARLAEVRRALRAAREAWLAALLSGARPRGAEEAARAGVAARQERVERLERRLAAFVGEGAYDWTVDGVTSQTPRVPDGAAVVEYFLVRVPQPLYYAFVVVGEEVHLQAIGDATSIHQALGRLRTHVVDERPRPGQADPAWRRRARFLFNRLLRPLLPWIGDARKLYVVPDAELFTLPFDLLPLDDGSLAIDRWSITHLWHGGELAGFNVQLGSPPAPGRPVVVSAAGDDGADVPGPWQFTRLPFAQCEGDAIARRIGADHLRGDGATKAAVIGTVDAEILHFAAHSFWIPRGPDPHAAEGAEPPQFRARSMIADPMYRSGIALAGAGRELNAPTAGSPGILFASEVLDLDLRSTDLVVLSSCQSGLGDPHPGDGIHGLRRAFRAAGARTVVGSLWKVPDDTTHDLMLDFYDRLLAGVPRGEALRGAKLALRERYPDDPLHWAAFVLDGSDEPLFRFSPARGLSFANFSGVSLSFARAMSHLGEGRLDEAVHQLERVMESESADPELRADARWEHAGILRRGGRLREALAFYDAMIDDVRTPAGAMRKAVADRALTRHLLGDLPGAYGDYTASLSAAGLSDAERAPLLVNRGALSSMMDDAAAALADCNEVLSMAGAPPEQRRMALLNRADLHRQKGDLAAAVADATALVDDPASAGSAERARAFLVLALCRVEQGDVPSARAVLSRHLDARVEPAPPGAPERLADARTPAALLEWIGELL